MKTYHVTTFGCQMNARDSEKLEGMLQTAGYAPASSEDQADLVIFNTCTVRENANERLYGHLGQLSHVKKRRPDLKIGICGCMMQDPSAVEHVLAHYPFVDIIFGTYNLHKLPDILDRAERTGERIIDIWEKEGAIAEDVPTIRHFPYKASVNITYGCNNFCSYCIVPYVRGRERSRRKEDILDECRKVIGEGASEIMLLGQNVNSYGKTLDPPESFAGLLSDVSRLDGLKRLRFMTSHPKDLSDDIIEVMAENETICHHLHLPLQSGSSRLLKIMNRRYTKEGYLSLVERLKNRIPDLALTTDIIVGFPGETEEDFLETMDVVEKVGFDSAFTFIYSKRSGTPAAKMPDQVPQEIIQDRFDRLLKLVHETGSAAYGKHENETVPVLAETLNRKIDGYITGRTPYNSIVHFPGTADELGKIVPVKLTECHGFYYTGERNG